MITHYDMVTGEVIDSENHEAPARVAHHIDVMANLRLSSLQEAGPMQTVGSETHRVVAMLPIAFLLDSGD
jgi:hypothetical protein